LLVHVYFQAINTCMMQSKKKKKKNRRRRTLAIYILF
jgi:hypothetical protein